MAYCKLKMKIFIKFQSILSQDEFIFNNKKYSYNEYYQLDQKKLKINYGFDINKEYCTDYKLIWKNNQLYGEMWLEPDDLNDFEEYIFSGKIIPVDIKLSSDNITKKQVNMIKE